MGRSASIPYRSASSWLYYAVSLFTKYEFRSLPTRFMDKENTSAVSSQEGNSLKLLLWNYIIEWKKMMIEYTYGISRLRPNGFPPLAVSTSRATGPARRFTSPVCLSTCSFVIGASTCVNEAKLHLIVFSKWNHQMSYLHWKIGENVQPTLPWQVPRFEVHRLARTRLHQQLRDHDEVSLLEEVHNRFEDKGRVARLDRTLRLTELLKWTGNIHTQQKIEYLNTDEWEMKMRFKYSSSTPSNHRGQRPHLWIGHLVCCESICFLCKWYW